MLGRQWACCCFFLLAVGLAWAVPAAAELTEPLPDWVNEVHRQAPPAEMVETLLEGLGDPRWIVRDEATRWLSLSTPNVYEALRQRYQQVLSREVRTRIRQVAREVFIRERMGPAEGFIGVRMDNRIVQIPPRVVADTEAVGIRIYPVRRTAAVEAGLRDGDIIVMLDHELLASARRSPVRTVQLFGEQIRARRPNEVIVLTVLRESQLLDVPVRLMPRPISQSDALTRAAFDNAVEDFEYFWNETFIVESPAAMEPATQPAADRDD
jgi:hypothetical protein